ncbi:TPA: hypothetical protein ACGPBE_000991, partial [Streptococcus suis]
RVSQLPYDTVVHDVKQLLSARLKIPYGGFFYRLLSTCDILLEIQEKEREHDGNLLQSHKLERH